MNRKAQGLSLNVIIVAVISLLVLVVLSVLLFRNLTHTDDSLKDCAVNGGFCVDYVGNCPSGKEIAGTNCPEATPFCCKRQLINLGDDEFEQAS